MTDIDDVIAAEHRRGAWSRRTIHDYAQRLRAFFLFAEARGWCRAGLAAGIMAPRFMADETVPKGLRREDVVRLLASVQGDRPVDKRDRAILMLFIAYGLRAGEVGGLRLDDLDWENEMLRVRCPNPAEPISGRCRRGRPRHSALHTGGAALRLRAQPLLHVARADPAARPKSPGQDRPRPPGGDRHRHRPTRNARACGMPRPSICWIRACR